MQDQRTTGLDPCPTDRTDRLLDEGVMPLTDAAQKAGLHPEPSIRTLLRAVDSGRLEALKFAGRWLTSPAAVRRWVAAEQANLAVDRTGDRGAEATGG